MSKALTNPLQYLVAKAAAALPVETGKVAAQQARLDRRKGETVILADVSGSMESPAWGGRRKIDVLREAVAGVKAGARLIAFSSYAREVQEIPEPDTHTDLAAGLRAALGHDPGTVLVVSDGQPDDEKAALDVAGQFRGVIDVLYIGPDSDRAAMAFMKRLAAAAGGEMVVNDLAGPGAGLLEQRLAGLLPGPAGKREG